MFEVDETLSEHQYLDNSNGFSALAAIGPDVIHGDDTDETLNGHNDASVDYADIIYIIPIPLFVGVTMAGLTAYVTLRLYIRR